MSISIPGRVVVFDYGEVISRSPSDEDRAAILRAAGQPGEAFWPVYWRHRDALDAGRLRVTDYWRRVATDLGAEWDLATIQRIWAADFRSWISVDEATAQLLDELHAGGTRLALLSNAGFDFGDPFRSAPTAVVFEKVFVSAELGMLKPDASIYRHVIDELDIRPEQLVFIDNKEVNVDGAVALGATGHVFRDASGLRHFLENLAEAA
ncbi:HAD family phosphatase [Homoserinibacter sp. GY 40078]|uniref:HAD family hydrolase n=1 Tax=Homoserinibacter sp. GY 40078 TaxID=2603275 RepID=UPI0011CC7577|nr:HAD family phosphatase [Homoserinibacter sp. GY 40078]TXK17210.1 HAD family phosphatase [Homoserinibacter sp. GY 40078]